MKLVGACRGWAVGLRRARLGLTVLALLAATRPALADEPPAAKKRVAVGFSNLVARLDNDEIGFARPEYRVHILEALRSAGFNAVGAENLVFGKDESERADVVLGGTVKELDCRNVYRELRCSVGVEWQLLDRERDEVVYRVLTRYAAFQLPRDNDTAVGKTLTIGALRSLMDRPRFRKLLSAEGQSLPNDADYAPATFTRCEATERELPNDFNVIADGTVLIKSGGGTGSGFTLGADGLVMTAAHVVASGKLEIRSQDGKLFPGRVVRISRKHDVALVSMGTLSAPRPCLPLESTPQTPGTDVYAIGAPGGEQLGFSLSRGIVSGLRTIGDVPLIQTDASLSPGNSGGPLVDRQGKVVGVVSRKIAGHAVEGLGFAIPIQAGLDALKLEPASTTTESLRQAPAPIVESRKQQNVNDKADPSVSLDPEGDRRAAERADYERRLLEQRAATPGYVAPMRWLGLTVGIVGTLGATLTGAQNSGQMTRAEYESLRLKNDLFWGATALGWGSFTASYFFVPKLGPSRLGGAPRLGIAAGPTDVQLSVSFQ
jgi:serine protease Do